MNRSSQSQILNPIPVVLECLACEYGGPEDPVVAVLRAHLLRDAEDVVVGIHPSDDRPFDLDRAGPGIQTRPDQRRDLPAVGTLPVGRSDHGYRFLEALGQIRIQLSRSVGETLL